MKYGVLFLVVAITLTAAALLHRSWYFICLWPAVAFAGLSLAYFTGNPRVFGKRADGTLAALNTALLLPVLALLGMVFHLARYFSRESNHNQVTNDIIIGRRLLSFEMPDGVDSVIDLTSEFTEPRALRDRGYHSFPILDADVPTESQLHDWLQQTDNMAGTVYIHFAQGHGRTALFTACLLLHRGIVATADEALELIQSRRPLARLNRTQSSFLDDVAPRVTPPPQSPND